MHDNEINMIDESLATVRDSAWSFATVLADEPGVLLPATIVTRDLLVAQQGVLFLNPPAPLSAGRQRDSRVREP
jgi:hypothetical protein